MPRRAPSGGQFRDQFSEIIDSRSHGTAVPAALQVIENSRRTRVEAAASRARAIPEAVPAAAPPRRRFPRPGFGGPFRTRRGRVALGGAGVFLVLSLVLRSSLHADAPAPAPEASIQTAGNIQPTKQTFVDFGVTGQILSISVKPGQSVAAGTVLASVDPATLGSQLTQSESALGAGQAKLALDSANNPGAVAQAAALGVVNQAQAQAAASLANLRDTQQLDQAGVVGAGLNAQLGAGAADILKVQAGAAQAAVGDVASVNGATVAGAKAVLAAAVQDGQAAVDVAQATVDGDRKILEDTRRTTQANVQVAQSTVNSAAAVVTADNTAITNDTNALNADQATATTVCTAFPGSPQCLTAQQTVANDKARLTADQQTLARDQGTLANDQKALDVARTAAKVAVDVAQATLNKDQATLDAAETALGGVTRIDQAAVDQAVAQGKLGIDQVTAQRDVAALTLRNAQGPGALLAQNTLQQAQLRAQAGDDAAQAQLQLAQVALGNATRSLQALHAPPAVQAIVIDQLAVNADEAQVVLAEHNLGRATLVAPLAGVVQEINIVEGQAVSPPATGAPHAIVLSTPDAYELTGGVRDSVITRVKLGDRVSVTSAGSKIPVGGTVTQIAPSATVRNGVTSFAVTATFEAQGVDLRPGMSATMRIFVTSVPGATTQPGVPNQLR